MCLDLDQLTNLFECISKSVLNSYLYKFWSNIYLEPHLSLPKNWNMFHLAEKLLIFVLLENFRELLNSRREKINYSAGRSLSRSPGSFHHSKWVWRFKIKMQGGKKNFFFLRVNERLKSSPHETALKIVLRPNALPKRTTS